MAPKKSVSKPKKSEPNDFLFDDCPICQAMKAAQERGRELSYEELQVAFAETNNQQSKKSN